MTEKEYKSEMLFLKKATRFALTDVERGLSKVQDFRRAREWFECLNNEVYLDVIIKASQFMVEAEQRITKLFRKYHKLD